MRSVRNKLPKRSSKFGVGKEIGGAVYLHRKYEGKLGNLLNAAKSTLPDDFDYQIVKYNYQTTPGASLFNRPSACVSQRRSRTLRCRFPGQTILTRKSQRQTPLGCWQIRHPPLPNMGTNAASSLMPRWSYLRDHGVFWSLIAAITTFGSRSEPRLSAKRFPQPRALPRRSKETRERRQRSG